MFVLLPLFSLADPPGPPKPGGGPTPVGTAAPSPIDGGLSILLALGAAYGGRKMYRLKKAQATELEE